MQYTLEDVKQWAMQGQAISPKVVLELVVELESYKKKAIELTLALNDLQYLGSDQSS